MKIVVIGGTGLIGSKVVARPTDDGHEAVPASPRLGINTITGEGLAAALDGASVVVDVSVVSDPDARYFGIAVDEYTLVPSDGSARGEIWLDDWLRQSAAATTAAA